MPEGTEDSSTEDVKSEPEPSKDQRPVGLIFDRRYVTEARRYIEYHLEQRDEPLFVFMFDEHSKMLLLTCSYRYARRGRWTPEEAILLCSKIMAFNREAYLEGINNVSIMDGYDGYKPQKSTGSSSAIATSRAAKKFKR